MFKFVKAGREFNEDASTAASLLSGYINVPVVINVDSAQSFNATILSVRGKRGALRMEFMFNIETESSQGGEEHVYRYLRSKVGRSISLKIAREDSISGVLSAVSDIPLGRDFPDYEEATFTIVLDLQKEKTASKNSAIIGVEVPENIARLLKVSGTLEYGPHVTVAYFPEVTKEEGKEVESLMRKAANVVGSFDVRADTSTVFPTRQDDGTFPYVALVEGQGIFDYHDCIIDLLEYHLPGLVSTEFVHQSFKPHVTLDYVPSSFFKASIIPVVWGVEHVTLNVDGPLVKVSLHRTRTASAGSSIQVGDVRVPIKVKSDRNNHLKFRVKDTRRYSLVEGLSMGDEVQFDLPKETRKVLVVNADRMANTSMFDVQYMSTAVHSPEGKERLSYVLAEANSRKLPVADRIGNLLNFEASPTETADEEADGSDVEALGPGFPGTDSKIVTYVKSKPTMEIPTGTGQNPKALELGKRI